MKSQNIFVKSSLTPNYKSSLSSKANLLANNKNSILQQTSQNNFEQVELNSQFNKMTHQQRLSTQFKSRKKIDISECNCGCETCLQNIQQMKEAIQLANKEVEYLQFMINFKEIGMEKREIMLNKYMEQMTQLHEDLKYTKIHNNKLQKKLEVYEGTSKNNTLAQLISNQNAFQVDQNKQKINTQAARRASSSSNMNKNNIFNQNNQLKDRLQIRKSILQQRHSSKFGPNTSSLINSKDLRMYNLQDLDEDSELSYDEVIQNIDERQMSPQASPKSNNSKNQSTKILQAAQTTNRSDKGRASSFSHSISVQIVTNTQGRQDDEVLFRNDQDSNSLMERGEEDLLSNKKLIFLERFFENQQVFYNQILNLKETQQKQLVKVVNFALNDLKRFFNLSLRYKELLNVTSEIAKYTSFDHAFDMILKKIIQHLKCDTASIFLVDYQSQELWTVANKTGKTIRFPLNDRSIAGYCIKHEIAMNVFDAYEDPRFNKQVDFDTGYRTKTILCVPIKDQKNQVVGCLEAINKVNDFFNKQDQEMLEIMGSFCSSILQNSLKFDKLLIQRDYYKKLIQVNNFIQDSGKIRKMMTQAEEKMKELLGSDRFYIYIIEKVDDTINLKRYVKGQRNPIIIENLKSGILYQVIQTQKLQKDQQPQECQYYDKSVDMDTNFPLFTVPIFNLEYTQILGIYQAENAKGFLHKHFGKDEDFQSNQESLYLYGEIIGNSIQKYQFFQKKIAKYVKGDQQQQQQQLQSQ
ncbi:GAF domain protein (macronuclear) [Tetrahymena thermophila SB210]|uniref:GAF domain protein n=1 Tax=Tetrahymena thermophila (strain SB210) TaxID=312017 RepID=Q23RX8_TETTS|nr:GAF domain protein [Tetrahymena thermophila SB210]EAR99261.2 GAF domain protein [Tetrahymena thermophila SB210]|eukprot:XP_001019506.2 GAF domain protein [Tetrahymena thermophila SB210]